MPALRHQGTGHGTTTGNREKRFYTDKEKRMKEQDIILQTVVKVMGMLRSGRINTYTRNIDIVRLIIKERRKAS